MQAYVIACKLMDLHASSWICMHSWTFWNILHEFWNILHEFWNILHEFCNNLNYSECILEHSGTFCNILKHSACILEHSGTFCIHSGTFWKAYVTVCILEHSGKLRWLHASLCIHLHYIYFLSGTVLNCLVLSGTVLYCLVLSCNVL